MSTTTYTKEQVASHDHEKDCWIIVSNEVYDVTQFLTKHPGGKNILLKVAGKDATKQFLQFHDPTAVLQKYAALRVGTLALSAEETPKVDRLTMAKQFGLKNAFGNLLPYSDPNWYQGFNSLYYGESHLKLREAVRDFVHREVLPYVADYDLKKEVPREIFRKFFRAGMLPGCIGPPLPKEYLPAGYTLAGGLSLDDYDPFHEMISGLEVSRSGAGGFMAAVWGGLSIGLPPVLHFGTKELKDRVVADCLAGEKCICLCITEPSGGSDVANLATTAVKSADGEHYIVNGEKKWITGGLWADYFTVAVRTGGPGMGGVSLMLLERNMPGITVRPMNCSGFWGSGTSYITFEDVKVPVGNLIGRENAGFKYIMYNFNHERWSIIVEAVGMARTCIEESVAYALKRKTFGKRLIDHPVIRLKVAHMARQVESLHAWLEQITYQLKTMPRREAMFKLGPTLALMKAHSSLVLENCAREASQIFGGLAYTQGGQGEKVERIYREVRAHAIPGGSEEIMLDLSVRMAMKLAML